MKKTPTHALAHEIVIARLRAKVDALEREVSAGLELRDTLTRSGMAAERDHLAARSEADRYRQALEEVREIYLNSPGAIGPLMFRVGGVTSRALLVGQEPVVHTLPAQQEDRDV